MCAKVCMCIPKPSSVMCALLTGCGFLIVMPRGGASVSLWPRQKRLDTRHCHMTLKCKRVLLTDVVAGASVSLDLLYEWSTMRQSTEQLLL